MRVTALDSKTELFRCPIYAGNGWSSSEGRLETLHNPATGQAISEVPHCPPSEVERAIEAAHAAFPAWRDTPAPQRARVLFRYRDLLDQHVEELARLVTLEHGKTLEESRGSVRRGMEAVEFGCGIPTLMMGETLENLSRGIDSRTIRQPLGVCVGIPPFNFPAMVPMWMFPLAIACGNTFVLKPSEKVPRTAVRLVELLYEAGLPAGVLQLVHGGKEVVDVLLKHPLVKAASFVGSSPVAKYVYETASANGKRVQALGGAKNHAVVMPDSDIREAAQAILASAFGCAGERCLATSVVVAVGEAAEPLLQEMKAAADAIRMGDGTNPETSLGPVVTEAHRRRVAEYVDIGKNEGARLVRDGRSDQTFDGSQGYFIGPTIFDDVRPGMKVASDEIFGPILGVMRARNLDEAIEIVNGSPYGNATAIYTTSGSHAREFALRIQAGMVGINVGVPAPMAFMPFAGWKGSFYGDLHAHGKDAIHFYTETKVITTKW